MRIKLFFYTNYEGSLHCESEGFWNSKEAFYFIGCVKKEEVFFLSNLIFYHYYYYYFIVWIGINWNDTVREIVILIQIVFILKSVK